MKPKLAICIPTYNRAEFIGDTIASVARQAPPGVEIVISDNASTDDTPEIVRHWQSRFPALVYHRCPENGGADRNYLKVVDLASAEYCWLLGSDDVLAPEAIATVLPLLAHAPDVVVTDRTHQSLDLSQSLGDESILSAPDGDTFDCSRHAELVRYFQAARGFTAGFPYISNLIVRRQAWLQQPVLEEFVGSAWIHVSQIFGILKSGGTLMYSKRCLVVHRADNDSFLSRGHCRRALIDLQYLPIARHYFESDPAVFRLLERLVYRQAFNLINLMSTRRFSFSEDRQNVRRLEQAYWDAFRHRPGFWPKMLVWRLSPPTLLNAMHRHKSLIRKYWPTTR